MCAWEEQEAAYLECCSRLFFRLEPHDLAPHRQMRHRVSRVLLLRPAELAAERGALEKEYTCLRRFLKNATGPGSPRTFSPTTRLQFHSLVALVRLSKARFSAVKGLLRC